MFNYSMLENRCGLVLAAVLPLLSTACPGPADSSAQVGRPEAAEPAATGSGATAPSETEARVLVRASADLLGTLAQSVRGVGSDCDALAAAIRHWSDEHRRDLAQVLGRTAAVPTAMRARLMREAVGDDPAISVVATALDGCHGHPGVASAVKKLAPPL